MPYRCVSECNGDIDLSLYLSPVQGAKELIHTLAGKLQELAVMMQASSDTIRIDALYEIPLRGTPTVSKAESIQVAPRSGREALELATEGLTSLWLKAAQSAKETLRAPGSIAVPGFILTKIQETNQLRMEIYGLIRQLDQQTRIDIWRSFPGISSLQALRVTPVLQAPLTIRFYWDTGSSGECKQVKDIIASCLELLEKKHGKTAGRTTLPDNSPDLKYIFAIEALEQLPPDEQVAICRPVTPHVRARVRDGEQPGYILSAPIPFVYGLEADKPRIKPLPDYEPVARTGQRSIRAQLMEEPYLESMNLYRYMEAHRRYGPVDNKDRRRNKRKMQAVAP